MYEVEYKKYKDTDKFRKPALTFKKYSYYTPAPAGTTEYMKYWETERDRCIEGYTADDGEYITGYNYFYLNYCQISLVREREVKTRDGVRMAPERVKEFPDFWDSDKQFFDAVEEAEVSGNHMAVLKARGKGYSFKGASMLNRNFYLIRKSVSYAIASEKEFLTKDGLLSKAWDMMDFLNEHTAWYKKRQAKDTEMHKRASYIVEEDGRKIERGYKSEIIGISLKNDIQKARGKRGKLILWEEAGKFPGLLDAWQIARPSVEQGGQAYGLMLGFGTGGCLTAGNKVFNNKGELKNIEDLIKDEGIIGFNEKKSSYSKEEITYQQPYTEKECVKLTTNSGRTLECSIDHPIYTPVFKNRGWNKYHKKENKRIIKHDWKEAGNIIKGDLISVIDEIPLFGNKNVKDARLLGMLIGDGTYGSSTPKFSNCDKELWDYIDANYKNTVYLKRKCKNGKEYKESRILNFNTQLREHNIFGQTKQYKRLPSDIHEWDKDSIINFISGLYDTDGYISFRKHSNRKNKYISQISISQANKEILKELQLLLQKFGIHGKLRIRQPRKNNPIDVNEWYEFNITDCRSLTLFAKYFNLLIKDKKDRLTNIYNYNKDRKPQRKYNGLRHEKIISIENVGIKQVYNLTASNTNTYLGNGIITHNTAEADYGSLKELFYAPTAYNVLPIRNIWDTGAEDTKCGFFIPQYMNLEGYMDDQGNSLINEAKEYCVVERRKVEEYANDSHAVDRHIAEMPFTPMEATLQLTGNIFPKKELSMQLGKLQTNQSLKNYKQVGELIFDSDGNLKWVQTTDVRDIIKYPLDRPDDKRGAIVIWEHPPDEIPYGLYVAGCLTPGEKVLTDKGLKNVEDVTLEDQLINKDGNYVNINTLLRYDKVDEPVYKVHMDNVDRPTIYTQEHPLYLSNTVDGNYDFIRARNIKSGMWTKYPNYYKINSKKINSSIWDKYKQTNTPNIDNPLTKKDFWWFVGHWLGDGFNHNQGRNFTIYNSFGNNEKEYVTKYKNIVSNIFNRKPHLKAKNGSFTHKFESKQLYLFLEDNFGKYAGGKYIAEWVKLMPDKYKLQLILGYLDSDGSVYKDRTLIKASFKSINRRLLNDIQDILFSLGVISKFSLNAKEGEYNIKNKSGKTKESYALRIGKVELKKLADKFESDYNSRKLKFAKTIKLLQKLRRNNSCIISEDNNYIYLKIKNIEENTYTGTVYNFDCETHTFVCQYCTGHNCDPYDHDDSGTGSLGSTFIYKRFQSFEEYHDIIVAEYTGRPNTAEEYYENVRKLLLYYNAKLLYENERKGLFAYFSIKGYDYLLAEQPDIISDIVKDSKVKRRKGIHMVQSIKDWGEREIRDWLNEEYTPGKKNLTRILSIPLLQELIAYNDKGNFDRVMALMMVMIYKKELHNVHVKEKTETNKVDPFFTTDWFPLERRLNFNIR